ncbi:glycine cleavage system protein GcvH [Streptomyces drozdowiczii]|uniref:Glycine cleavage system H protein n=1 Tax=Streptomyces drozdowiczii TaxID=202862 RepID=A0ABY6Q0F5_9ACTN|nr:glycine cleavage system protein GcvH [Streptomyces drozdowiczii]MCX0241981.1 glycine cleavage system protein GcvH [Streptomyces drozdowiczii]UZK57912.1 glycine cleavage system protein GcvH [Streptomyces drozdowiczii]
MIPEELRYTEKHVWVLRTAENGVRAGITDYAQEQLGAVVSAHLPRAGDALAAGQCMGQVKSTVAAFDLYAPVSGTVVAVNDDVAARPETVNDDPYGEGWLVEIDLTNVGELGNLLDASAYQDLTGRG